MITFPDATAIEAIETDVESLCIVDAVEALRTIFAVHRLENPWWLKICAIRWN